MTVSLPEKWTDYLGLSYRKPPEFFQSSEEVIDVPHAGALRDCFGKLGLSAVFCVQGIPTIALLEQSVYDQSIVTEIHAALWNQGLASLLLVTSEDTLRVFSLARRTVKGSDADFKDRCLITTLQMTTDALALRELISGAESGRLWEKHSKFFPFNERVDSILLSNLSESYRRLCRDDLPSEASQSLLMQIMFISYLEDRGIITPAYIKEATNDMASDFSSVLASGNQKLLVQLFKKLRTNFNGDLFVAPCSFEPTRNAPTLTDKHLLTLSSFHTGKEEMTARGGQLRFWGYNFKYIPVELISAVYDRFLGEREDERRKLGAYYTPMFLADTVITQVWDTLPPTIKDKGTFFDPACGSGVFLVRMFQRLCDHWRATRQNQQIRWDSLLNILKRLYGGDVNGSAVRVAVFSLYIALLEQVDPPDFPSLIKKERILPELWNKTFVERNFFSSIKNEQSYDVIIGNPPWTSRRGADGEAVKWGKEKGLPIPGGEAAWGFVWKALSHVTPQGLIAFLLPAMGFLHNHSDKTVSARNKFVCESHILRVINFADLRFQLFDGANRPAALILFQKAKELNAPYRFEYWMPKADLNLRLKRFITLSSNDKARLRSNEIEKDPFILKRRLWMRTPDAKLFHYLDSLPKLGGFIKAYGELKRQRQSTHNGWVIGQGFQPFNNTDNRSSYFMSDVVNKYPFLDISNYSRLIIPNIAGNPWHTKKVRRKGFESGYTGARILIPKGIETAQMRFRASYTEQNLCFTDALQAITVPRSEKENAKFITALLNSRLAIWFAFHGTSSFGSDRPLIHQEEILYIPSPNPDDLPDPKKAKKAKEELVSIIDDLFSKRNRLLSENNAEQEALSKIDRLTYEYFCLSENEIAIIEDTVQHIIPAMQPHQGNFPDLWKTVQANDRKSYAKVLKNALADWLNDNWTVNVSLDAKNSDLGILRLMLSQNEDTVPYQESSEKSYEEVLGRLWQHMHNKLSGNFQLLPDFRMFIDGDLYLVKPMQKRFWLRSTALADADSIAADLQHIIMLNKKAG